MFRRRPHATGTLLVAVLLISSVDFHGASNATDCPCEVLPFGDATCENASQAPPCLLSKNVDVLLLELPTATELTSSELASVPGLLRLHLIAPSLTTIRSSAFANNPLLSDLILEIPNVTTLEAGTFRSLPKLKRLQLESGIQSLEEDEFEL
ncbi:uncharacterized protein LOC126293665 [Schistocerca gregaria]|uniref:uncharacterized protein LOC126293665 n=1 Tax=Schistocerca gregaria TaxID=7010 RepID=UPI00211DD39B|nr:uncharacterized protein LOC126293665 [Schistocerca gregaria]